MLYCPFFASKATFNSTLCFFMYCVPLLNQNPERVVSRKDSRLVPGRLAFLRLNKISGK